LGIEFDFGYCSLYLQAIHAVALSLPYALENFWRIFFQVRERDWGTWNCVPLLTEYLSRTDKMNKAKAAS